MTETPEARLKRVTMRSWRRGMKEMDIILGRYADARLAALDIDVFAAYERLLEENDQDLFKWVSGAAATPARHAPMIAEIKTFHKIE